RVPSAREPVPPRLAKAARGDRVRRVTAARTSQLSEYLAEAIPPVGLPDGFSVVMDRSLAQQAVVYFPGGESTAVLKVRGADLVRAAEARVARIAAGPTGTGRAPGPRTPRA